MRFSFFAGRFEFAVARRENLGVAAFQFVFRRHEPDGAVRSDLVVAHHELAHDTSSVVERQRRLRSNAFGLEGLVPPLEAFSAPSVTGDLRSVIRSLLFGRTSSAAGERNVRSIPRTLQADAPGFPAMKRVPDSYEYRYNIARNQIC